MNRKQRRLEKKQNGGPDRIFTEALRHHQAGRLREAEALYRQVLAIDPRDADSLHLLGVVGYDTGRLDLAADLIPKAIAIDAGVSSFHCNFGNVLRAQGYLDRAAASYRRALSLKPDYPEALNGLGNVLADQGARSAAIEAYRRALALNPNYAEAHSNLGAVYLAEQRPGDADTCYQRAIRLDPKIAIFHLNLGYLRHQQWRLGEAAACFERALTLRPGFAEAHNNLGNVLKDQGQLAAAAAHYQRARESRPDFRAALSNQILVQNYLDTQTPAELLDLARQFGAQVTAQAQQAFTRWPEAVPDQPLRVGLVSGDLWNHPVGFFLEGLLRAADPARIVFLAFPTSSRSDALTARIKPYFAAWQPIDRLADRDAAALIHGSGVHVLLDLAGHTAGNRLPVFGWRPAPVQAAWLGYFATTGVAEIDYVIGDPQVAPVAEDGHFTETLWRLPDIYYCFTPPEMAVTVADLPALANGYVTFGCFNNLTKLNDAVVATWAQILLAVPGSRLMLKAPQLQDAGIRTGIHARFAAHGIGAERLITEGSSAREDYLRAYHRIDIALDPFPYPGGTTSFEALWMGVPVLTRRGDRFLSHVGETIAGNAGLPEWVAVDADDYVARAVRFAGDPTALAALRRRLRDQVLASPLFDAARFARHFADALWGMWQDRGAPRSGGG